MGLPDGYKFKQGMSIIHISESDPNERGFDKVEISEDYVPAREIYSWLFDKK